MLPTSALSLLLAVLLLIAQPARADVAALAWMSGCWSADGQERGSIEQWSLPAGGSMLGMNRTVTNGKTVFFEFLRIVDEADGSTVLIASPAGQETARFRMTDYGPAYVVFDNPEHDFPQRIAYRLTADGKLLGHIEGSENGETRSADFPMSRIACDAGAEHD